MTKNGGRDSVERTVKKIRDLTRQIKETSDSSKVLLLTREMRESVEELGRTTTEQAHGKD